MKKTRIVSSLCVGDGGGNGFRKATYKDGVLSNFVATKKGEITTLEQLIAFFVDGLPKDNAGIAIAMAGDIKDGIVINSPQIPWLNGVNLERAIARASGKDVLIVNDMDGAVAGMAELSPEYEEFAGITWSSGFGKRIWRENRIWSRGESAHIRLDMSPFALRCGCGLYGCFETVLGGEAIRLRVIRDVEVMGRKIPEGMHPCRFLDDRFKARDQWAVKIYDSVALGMALYLNSLLSHDLVPLIVWKGTFASNAFPLIRDRIQRYMQENIMNQEWERNLRFEFSRQPETDALIGAAALFKVFK